ncbi:hypothetical protein RYO59_000429 [Thermosynechococcaceae cyanobacterium Okahandja]
MSDAATQSELGQVLDAIKSIQSDIKAMQSDIQAMDKKLDLHIATTAEKFNTLEERLSGEIKAVRTEIQLVRAEVKALDDKVTVQIKALDDKVTDLRDRQKVTDSRLWAFIVALVTLVGGSVIKVLWFDRA